MIDVSTPAFPVEVGAIVTGGFALGVTVSGNSVYVGARGAGLRVIDVSTPARARRGGIRRAPLGLLVVWQSPVATPRGGWAKRAGGGGLSEIDVSDTGEPQPGGIRGHPWWDPQALRSCCGYAYVAARGAPA